MFCVGNIIVANVDRLPGTHSTWNWYADDNRMGEYFVTAFLVVEDSTKSGNWYHVMTDRGTLYCLEKTLDRLSIIR